MLGVLIGETVVALGTWNRENSVIVGMRGDFLEKEMAQLRTIRHWEGIRRLGGGEHSRKCWE